MIRDTSAPRRLRAAARIAAGLLVALASCQRPGPVAPPGPPEAGEAARFADATAGWGLDFTHDPGPAGTYFMPQSMGSGAAVLDADGDGLLDIYLLQFGGPESKSVNRLYLQTAPGKFRDATAGSGLDVPGHNHGVAVGDVNNDGRPDLAVSQFGGLRLFLNLGGGKFTDATAESGLVNLSWGMSAAFVDFDLDGRLDLFVANYLDYDPKHECRSPEGNLDFCGPNAFPGTRSKLFRNGGPRDKARVFFEDVSLSSGVARLPGPGLGVAAADFTGDGWPDLFVANDGQPNRLWVNQKNGAFADEAVSRNVAYTTMGRAYAGMGVGVGDVNGDRMLDLFVTHLGSETHTLWLQNPRGRFRDRTVESGLTKTRWRGTGFGTALADLDNDGWPDAVIANGRVARGGPASAPELGFWEPYAEKNQVLLNDGKGGFRDISPSEKAVCDYWNVGRGVVCADFDNDGGVDLLVTADGSKARLFRNVNPNRGYWLKVRAIDPKLNRDVYGAEVVVRAGGKEYLRVINPAESFLCSAPPVLHFGLGAADAVEWVRVTWPGGPGMGGTEVFPGGAAGREVVLRRGEGQAP